jgi:hypothetical protein
MHELSEMEAEVLCTEMLETRGERYQEPAAYCTEAGRGAILAPGVSGCIGDVLEFSPECDWTIAQERACHADYFAQARDLCTDPAPASCARSVICPQVPVLSS